MIQLHYQLEGKERIFPLVKDDITIGRSNENDIVINDFSVSRKHCRFKKEKDNWLVYDLKSTNGVKVNDKFVTQAIIADGDIVLVGTFPVTFRDDPKVSDVFAPGKKLDEKSSTFIRSINDFNVDFNLDKDLSKDLGGKPVESTMMRKRVSLDVGYKNKIFEILVQVAKTLISAEALSDVLEKVMDIIFEYLPVDRGFLLLHENGQFVPKLARYKNTVGKPQAQQEVPVSRSIVDMVVQQKLAILTYDALSDKRFDTGESIRIHQIRSAMCVPLWSKDSVIGVIHVDSPIHVGSFTAEDLDLLTALGNYAAVAIERARLNERIEQERRIRSRLERYHSPAVIDEIISDREDTRDNLLKAKARAVTVMFVDVVSFTTLSENLDPAMVAEFLNKFFTHAVEGIFDFGGTLDKFIGDEVMAFFGAPIEQNDHALRAVRAAVKIRDAIAVWNVEREAGGELPVRIRTAINSGYAVVGDIGSDKRVDYTVLGNSVNIAARLEQFVAEPGDIVIGEETYEATKEYIHVEALGPFSLKGLQQQTKAFRVKDLVA